MIDTKLWDAIIGKVVAIQGKISNIEYHLLMIKDKGCIAKLMILHSSLLDGYFTNESAWYMVNELYLN